MVHRHDCELHAGRDLAFTYHAYPALGGWALVDTLEDTDQLPPDKTALPCHGNSEEIDDDNYCRGLVKKIETENVESLVKGTDVVVKTSKPKTMQEAIEFTTELMDEKTHAYAERQAERKIKYDDLSKNNQNQQQQNKRQNTGQAHYRQ
ncbi:hypothetical protein Tco_0992982 [Tanacetum coccineum]|uniref:Uncharacterized protein n=1 Tax=Tanacetum coccineum TaxID=301880 RepID=A0ABQ5F3M3_9ASTR